MREYYPEMITLKPALSLLLKIKKIGKSSIIIKHKQNYFTFGVMEIVIQTKK
jgi:hypothetical protein